MVKSKGRKQINDTVIRAVFSVAMYAVLAVFIIVLFSLSADYTKIYNTPKVRNGRVDFDGFDISSRASEYNLAGEWEFFYNKWIITDGEDCAPDGMIKLPDIWTYKDFGHGRLPKTGYASYRLYAENITPDVDIVVLRRWSNFAYRVFLNGQLTISSGTISKDVNETVVTRGEQRLFSVQDRRIDLGDSRRSIRFEFRRT